MSRIDWIAAAHPAYPTGDVRRIIRPICSVTAGEAVRNDAVSHRSRVGLTNGSMPRDKAVLIRGAQTSGAPSIGVSHSTSELIRSG